LDRKFVILVPLSVVVGFMITWVSGFFMTPFVRMGVDVVHRGMLIPWSIQVIPRESTVLWSSFIVDLAFWILIALAVSFIVLYTSTRRHKRGNPA
jgi:hypothetical protein